MMKKSQTLLIVTLLLTVNTLSLSAQTIDNPSLVFENNRIQNAYIALQALKQAILSDPLNFTTNWVGSNVCSYTGIYCAQALDNPNIRTVAGIDLNHADIAGYLPDELGLLTDLALFHINSNRFCGTVPHTFEKLKLLFELDLSNNRFAGKFPKVVLSLPVLKFLDIRFNEFEGTVPKELFDGVQGGGSNVKSIGKMTHQLTILSSDTLDLTQPLNFLYPNCGLSGISLPRPLPRPP